MSAMKREIYTEDHDDFRSAVRTWIERDVLPHTDEYIAAKALPREFWLKAGENGFLGLSLDEEYGGAGDFRFNAVLEEELAKVGAAYPTCVGIHTDITAPYINELGTPEQKERWLPGVASGEILLAIGMTEPSGGSDLAALKTNAVRDGSDWILNGSKTFITNGYTADMIVVAARTDPSKGARGITLFAVETGMPGFERGRKLDKVGQHPSDTAELFFSDVRLPQANVIGEEGQGFIYMMERLPQERIGGAISNLAHAQGVFDETLEYVKERKAFGQAIGKFQHNKFLLAELRTKLDVTQAFIDTLTMQHVRGELSSVEAAQAKYWSADVENEVIDACVQLHGGYGYMTEYRVARAWMDARVTKIWAGSNEIMKELIGRDLGL
jgi:acyl-CoA dehydrogenase